jgi:aspartate-semialdehyde dehydrogenase
LENESVASTAERAMVAAPGGEAGSSKMNQPCVAIVGATGAVGVEMLLCLEQRNFPLGKLKLLASARSAGKKMTFRGEEITVEELTHDSFGDVDIALFSAGGGISKEFGPSAAAAGAVVIDNSSAFRMDADVPLVVPEINPEAAKNRPRNIIANPNCTTIISLMALKPLHDTFGLKSIVASTYQAVSGSGAQGIVELEEQMKAINAGEPVTLKVYPRQIAFNVIPGGCFHRKRLHQGGAEDAP